MSENKEVVPDSFTIAAEDLVPGLMVLHDGEVRQVRGVTLHGSRYIMTGEQRVTQSALSVTVVFCNDNGKITTVKLPTEFQLPLVFVEVFEPGVPRGYVSEKNYKKCYEKSLAAAESIEHPSVVNRGSCWRTKEDVASLMRTVPKGTDCTAYAVAEDQTACRLMLPSGGDLGHIGIKALRRLFFYVGEAEVYQWPTPADEVQEKVVTPTKELVQKPVLVNSEWELKDPKEANAKAVGKRRWVISVLPNCGFPLFEMADKHGTSLGHTRLENMHKYYTFVRNDSKPTDKTLVKLTYFKPGGKYYSEGEYYTQKDSFWQIIDEVYARLLAGENPGLTSCSVLTNDFTTSIDIQDELLGIPHVITAQALCAEMVRKGKNGGRPYTESLPTSALALYNRHQKHVDALLPESLKDTLAMERRSGT